MQSVSFHLRKFKFDSFSHVCIQQKKNPSKKYHSFENTLFQHYTSAYIIEGQVYHFRYLHNTHIKCKNVSLIFNIETLDADDKKREEKKNKTKIQVEMLRRESDVITQKSNV